MVVFGLAFFIAAAPASARSRLDAEVDALTARQVLSSSPVALVDAGRQRRARALADLEHLDSAGWGLVQIAGYWWFWRSGYAARLRDVMRRRTRSRVAQRAVFGAVLGILGPLLSLPWALAGYRLAYGAGLTGEPYGPWLAGAAIRIAFDAVVGAAIVAGVLALVERLRIWYAVVAVAIEVVALGAVIAAPLVPLGTALKPTPNALAALQAPVAAAAGVAGTPVEFSAAERRRSRTVAARAAGYGPTGRVIVADVDLDHFTPPELRTLLAREDVHLRRGDPLREAAIATTLFVVCAALAVLIGERVPLRRDDDALSRLALIATLLGIVLAAAYPLYQFAVRSIERATDAQVLAVDPDRVADARALAREADLDLIPLCDRRSVRWYFDDRPPLGSRIARAAGTVDPCEGALPR